MYKRWSVTHFLIKSVLTAFMAGTAMIKPLSIMRHIQLLEKPQEELDFTFTQMRENYENSRGH